MDTPRKALQPGLELNFSLWFAYVCGAVANTVVLLGALILLLFGFWRAGPRGDATGLMLTVLMMFTSTLSLGVFIWGVRKYRGVTVREEALELGKTNVPFSSIVEVSLRNRHLVHVVYRLDGATHTLSIGYPSYSTHDLGEFAQELKQAAGLLPRPTEVVARE